ncbi:MAG: ABC transporter permease, partial [Coriobacteriales bacterium]|nr:ABC transporter permease [Coriobacteriales bacterium]
MLLRKMLRDLGGHKAQFFSIFLMAFLAVFVYAGIGGEWRGIENRANQFYDDTALPDAWVYGAGFTEAQAERLRSSEAVETVELRADGDAVAHLSGSPELALSFNEGTEASRPLVREGRALDPDDAEGIWLAERFCSAHGLALGDPVEIRVGELSFTRIIRGTILSPEYVFLSANESMQPDFALQGYAWLGAAAWLLPTEPTWTTLAIVAADGVDASQLESAVTDALNDAYQIYLPQNEHASVSMVANEIAQHRMMGDIFPVVFLLIALLSILTTMTRLVTGQRQQIGVLRALGFSRATLLVHYLSYGLLLTAFGATLGVILGPLSLPYLFFPSMSGFYSLPAWGADFDVSFALAALAVVGLATLVSWLTCARLLVETPSASLRPKPPKTFRHGIFEHTRLWRRAGFNVQWNLRDIVRNRARSLMAIIGVLGCTALVLCALAMISCLADTKAWSYEHIMHYQTKLILAPDASEQQIAATIHEVAGEPVLEGTVELQAVEPGTEQPQAGTSRRIGALTVLEKAGLISPTDTWMRPMDLPEEGILLSEKLAEQMGIVTGDAVRWHLYGTDQWVVSVVTALDRNPSSQGIMLSRAVFEADSATPVSLTFTPTTIVTAQVIETLPVGVESLISKEDILGGWDTLTEAMYLLVYVLLLAAAILAMVVLYNLGLLTFTEMQREMATLKVLGFKTGTLRGLLFSQNLWLSIIGFLLGIPGGYALLAVLLHYSGDEFDFPIIVHPLDLAIAAVFTFALAILVNLLFSR